MIRTVSTIVMMLFSVSAAHAKPPSALEKVQTLEQTLTEAGWTMTPERSASYTVGDIYSRTSNTPIAFKDDCFDAEPRENAYTSLEVVQAMKAGTRIPLGVARFKAEGMEYKQLKFAEPYMTELAEMHLRPSQTCQRFLANRQDLADLFVIKAVLSAEVKEQLCRSIDGAAGALGLGINAEAQQQCAQESEGHVAVAYRTLPAATLLQTMAVPDTVPPPVAAPSQATATMNFQSGAPTLGVEDQLRAQRCAENAKTKGKQARQARIDEAIRAAQGGATQNWTQRVSELEQCTRLKRSDRTACIDATEDWITRAQQMVVDMPAGVEVVETECGPTNIAFEAEQHRITADKLGEAQALLKRLSQEDTEGCGEPASSMQLMMSLPMSRVDPVVRGSPDIERCVRDWHERQQLRRWVLQLPIKMTVGANGQVQCVETMAGGGDVIDAELRSCVSNAVRDLRFQVQNGPVTLTYPLTMRGQ